MGAIRSERVAHTMPCALRPQAGIDLLAFNVVKLSDGSFDLALVGLDVNNKNKRVAIFDQFHRGLGGEGVLDHGESVKSALLWGALSLILWLSGGLQSLGLVKVDFGVDASSLLGNTLLKGIRHCRCFAYHYNQFVSGQQLKILVSTCD